MKAKEFMLNDLVYRKEHEEFHKPVPRSVVKIDGVTDNDMITFAPHSEFLDMDEIEPIPLTAEILQKNATSVTKDGCCTYYEFDDNFAVKKFSGFFFFCELENGLSLGKGEIQDNTWMQMHYVHELQHALRLVGLGEIADNIKV